MPSPTINLIRFKIRLSLTYKKFKNYFLKIFINYDFMQKKSFLFNKAINNILIHNNYCISNNEILIITNHKTII
ncbi:uncharacterized protein BUCNMO_154 [Buchnera aphidicola (Nipponaphis monzeni)]|uniref:Uncharacterized protein n=1 Tax=Buchnera aphidicola (Nipponaphis monzeni) TaxID=2495405 RepID=A0A455TA21_9GAMM|nr:uncharacterized protein BUCNMO_154 [Buchnera aphidicola (Nipponaphis monzeni)]